MTDLPNTEWSLTLARWVLTCPECKLEFTHSQVKDTYAPSLKDAFSWICDKPELPDEGIHLRCPNCMSETAYKRYQLIYRAD